MMRDICSSCRAGHIGCSVKHVKACSYASMVVRHVLSVNDDDENNKQNTKQIKVMVYISYITRHLKR